MRIKLTMAGNIYLYQTMVSVGTATTLSGLSRSDPNREGIPIFLFKDIDFLHQVHVCEAFPVLFSKSDPSQLPISLYIKGDFFFFIISLQSNEDGGSVHRNYLVKIYIYCLALWVLFSS